MQRLERYGDEKINEEKAMAKFLRVIPKKYSQLTISIETLLDLSTLSIEVLMGLLKAFDDRDEPPSGGEIIFGGQLHLTEERWLAREKERKEGESSSSTGGRKCDSPSN